MVHDSFYNCLMAVGCCKDRLDCVCHLSTYCKMETCGRCLKAVTAFVQEADQKLLAHLAEQEAQDQCIQSARREKARADAAWMKKVCRVF